MTKKEIGTFVELLVEEVAQANGATISTVTIKVGGKPQDSRKASGGVFDLDAARSLVGQALKARHQELVAACRFGPVTQAHNPATVAAAQ